MLVNKKLCASLVLVLSALTLAACGGKRNIQNEYRVARSADSATISGRSVTESGTFGGRKVKAAIIPFTVDGRISRPHADVVSNPLLAINAEPLVIEPGKRSIGALFYAAGRTSDINVSFDATANERYKFNFNVAWVEGTFADTPTSVSYWVENSKGEKVTEPTVLTPHFVPQEPQMVPVYVPVRK